MSRCGYQSKRGYHGWIQFSTKLLNSPKKVIPELNPLIKIESRVGDIGVVTFQPRKGEGAHTYTFDKVVASIVGLLNAAPYEIYIDCLEELPRHAPSGETTWNNLQLKFILISHTSVYNPERKWRHMWEDWQLTNVFLVIRPFGQHWKKVGILKTKDKLYRNLQQMTAVLT